MTTHVLMYVESTEACSSCGEIFTEAEQHAFDPADNDHCPKCGDRGSLTTYYGDPEYRLQEHAFGDPDKVFVGPIPMRLVCPGKNDDGTPCARLHIDEGDFATKPHHTHACQFCGEVWRPAVVPTVGVRFLPGFRNEAPT